MVAACRLSAITLMDVTNFSATATSEVFFHFHLQLQYKYELFHIKKNFTSFHCTGRYELNKLTSLPMCGFIAQLVEHRTGIAEVTGSNPVEVLIFFRLLLSNCLNWKIYCDDHISLSSTTAVQIWIISYKKNFILLFVWQIKTTYLLKLDALRAFTRLGILYSS